MLDCRMISVYDLSTQGHRYWHNPTDCQLVSMQLIIKITIPILPVVDHISKVIPPQYLWLAIVMC